MPEEFPLTSLGSQILAHRIEYRPQMVRSLKTADQLARTVFETQEICAEMLYQLIVVQKLSYPAAWEIVRAEWMLAEEVHEFQNPFSPGPAPVLT